MDRLLYIAMSAARHTSINQNLISNNIANANTDGFKMDLLNIIESDKSTRTRVYSEIKESVTQTKQGVLKPTGNKNDVASVGGWLNGLSMDGTSHYISTASLMVDSDGLLSDHKGNLILNAGGDTIEIGDVQSFTIGSDGSISAVPIGGSDADSAVLDTIGLFDIDKNLRKDAYGRLVVSPGAEIVPSIYGKIETGVIEGSNVIMAQEMLNMIENNRQYEFATKLIETAKGMHSSSSRLLR